jgi:hypothetical protein
MVLTLTKPHLLVQPLLAVEDCPSSVLPSQGIHSIFHSTYLGTRQPDNIFGCWNCAPKTRLVAPGCKSIASFLLEYIGIILI